MLFDKEKPRAGNLNDDALGRVLDSLYEAGPKRCFQSIVCGAVSRGYLQVKSAHADTTSVSLWREYEPTQGDRQFAESNPDHPLIDITHEFSKQHRPDLKQFVYGLVVSAEGVPLLGDVNDGNISDKTWNQRTIEEIKTSILDPQSIIYIADSALVTGENLDAMTQCKIRFVSRLSETYKVAEELKERAWSSKAWKEQGAFRTAKDAAHYATQSLMPNCVTGPTGSLLSAHLPWINVKRKRLFTVLSKKETNLMQKPKSSLSRFFNAVQTPSKL